MGNPRVGRTGDAIPGVDLVHAVAVAEQAAPFEHDEDLDGHEVRVGRARAVARGHPHGVHAKTAQPGAARPCFLHGGRQFAPGLCPGGGHVGSDFLAPCAC